MRIAAGWRKNTAQCRLLFYRVLAVAGEPVVSVFLRLLVVMTCALPFGLGQ